MPPKKGQASQKASVESGQQAPPLLHEGMDPITAAIAVVDKKARNLEKRKNKLSQLKDNLEQGTQLDKDQQEAVSKIGEVTIQLELVKELQKQFAQLQTEYTKSSKRQQKLERQQAKDAENEAKKRAVSYTMRIQHILNSMGEDDRGNFKTGSCGAVALTETELDQIDELYKVVTPTRENNPDYLVDVNTASESLLLLMDKSSKGVFGTTYKQLHEMLQRVDDCGYFDRPTEEEEEAEEGEPEDDDYKSADDQIRTNEETRDNLDYNEQTMEQPEIGEPNDNQYLPPNEPSRGPWSSTEETTTQQIVPGIITQSNMMNYMPSAPSPTFPGLGGSPVQPSPDDSFSFMHESEVNRTQSSLTAPSITTVQQVAQQPQATQQVDYSGFVDGGGVTQDQSAPQEANDQGTTDVATGQPSPSVEAPFPSGIVTMESNIMMSSVPSSELGTQGQLYSGATSGQQDLYRQQQQPYNRGGGGPNRGVPPPGGNRGGRTFRHGGPKGGGGYRNGRGPQSGYDTQGGYSNSKGYQSGYQGRGGGRPNYRTGGGGVRK